MHKANASKSRGQREKEEELRRVPREYNLKQRSIINVYFSWTLDGCLRPPELGFSSTKIKAHFQDMFNHLLTKLKNIFAL